MHILLGILIAVAGGAINGLFALPMKAARRWAWENLWFLFSLLSLGFFPWVVALLSVPDLGHAVSQMSSADILQAMLWGVAAYSGSLLFGISLSYIGMALGFALLVGSMSAVGVLAPLLIFHPEALSAPGGGWIVAGMCALVPTLFLTVIAGRLKERAQGEVNTSGIGDQTQKGGWLGMLLALLGGALSGLLALGMNLPWAHALADVAVKAGGAEVSQASNAALAFVLLGGSALNVLYCLYRLCRNATWARYHEPGIGSHWLVILLICLMYSGSVALWGVSISPGMLGVLGPSVGWALFIGSMVISSNVGGFASGEWKGAGRRAVGLMVAGLACMLVAMVLIGYGNYLVAAN